MIKPGETLIGSVPSSLIQALPKAQGTYALFMHIPESRQFRIGRLGEIFFPAGDYVYLGSANGSGGLQARLGRHLRGDGTPHWHIDHLRKMAQASGYCYVIAGQGAQHLSKQNNMPVWEKLECRWSQALAALSGASIPASGFGGSDCHAGCPAHLVAFLNGVAPKKICSTLARSAAVSCNPHPLIHFVFLDNSL